MLTAIPCRDCPTTQIPVTAYSETDLLAFDIRAIADRVERLGLQGREDAVATLREIADAVEHAAGSQAS